MSAAFPPSRLRDVKIRLATPNDISKITTLIDRSVRNLQKSYYTPDQIELALEHVYGVDSQLISDSTYFVITRSFPTGGEEHVDGGDEIEGGRRVGHLGEQDDEILACGGWSFRSTLYGGDQFSGRAPPSLLNPLTDAARIRAFFVDPNLAKSGLGSMIYGRCEEDAKSKGWKRFEVGATLSGVAFYEKMGFKGDQRADAVMGSGEICKYIVLEHSMFTVWAGGTRLSLTWPSSGNCQDE